MIYHEPTIEDLEHESAALHQRMLEIEEQEIESDGLYDAILERMAEISREIHHLTEQGE